MLRLRHQVLKEQEHTLAESKQAVDKAAAAVERKQQELAVKEAALADTAAKLDQQQHAAAAAAEELDRQRKSLEAARRGLAGVEAALDAREAQMAESWGQLASNTAALKAGDLEGLSTRASVSAMAAITGCAVCTTLPGQTCGDLRGATHAFRLTPEVCCCKR